MGRAIVDNMLSGTKACFKTALTIIFNNLNRRKIMPINKNKISKMQSLLLTLTLMVAAFWVSSAVAAEKETVFDPATGKTWTAPEYGGTLTWATKVYPPSTDNWWNPGWAPHLISGVNERLSFADWGLSRDIWNGSLYQMVTPEMTRGCLAESWSMPDDTTFIWNIRKGVYWDDKAPVNGREFDAYDVEWNYHRMLGLGDFTEDGPMGWIGAVAFDVGIESVTATDKWTVVMKLTTSHPSVLGNMLNNYWFAHAPEQIEKYGDAKDWRTLVGTGPLRLTDFVEGSSATWKKNPNYWGYDEKFPQNRLPYIDEYRSFLMPDMSTRLAALRTGKIDMLSNTGDAYIQNIDDVESLQRSNPEIEVWSVYEQAPDPLLFNWALPPVSDVNVRKALQMAVDRETISATYFKGYGEPAPYGLIGQFNAPGWSWPMEEWPEEVKQEYTYNPERAEELLDEAGYTRGADGYRFKLKLALADRFDSTHPEIVMGFFEAIGVDSELFMQSTAEVGARGSAGSAEWHLLSGGYGIYAPSHYVYLVSVNFGYANWNYANDPQMDALLAAMQTATTVEEWKSYYRQADEITVREHWGLVKSLSPRFFVNHPWVKGYFGEAGMGNGERNTFLARLWIDQELKKAMGH